MFSEGRLKYNLLNRLNTEIYIRNKLKFEISGFFFFIFKYYRFQTIEIIVASLYGLEYGSKFLL